MGLHPPGDCRAELPKAYRRIGPGRTGGLTKVFRVSIRPPGIAGRIFRDTGEFSSACVWFVYGWRGIKKSLHPYRSGTRTGGGRDIQAFIRPSNIGVPTGEIIPAFHPPAGDDPPGMRRNGAPFPTLPSYFPDGR